MGADSKKKKKGKKSKAATDALFAALAGPEDDTPVGSRVPSDPANAESIGNISAFEGRWGRISG